MLKAYEIEYSWTSSKVEPTNGNVDPMLNVSQALYFLIEAVFSMYMAIVFTRFMLQVARADFYNPLSQLVVKATAPLLNPLRRVIPSFGGIDNASLLLVVALMFIKLAIIFAFFSQATFSGIAFIYILAISLIKALLEYFFWLVALSVLFSWVAQGNPYTMVLFQLSEPILAPVRKIMPDTGMLDLSPMIVLLLIGFFKVMVGG